MRSSPPTWPVVPVIRIFWVGMVLEGKGKRSRVKSKSFLVDRLFEDAQQVFAVGGFGDFCGKSAEIVGVDVAEPVGDLFGAGHLQALAMFEGVDEVRRFQQRVVRAGIEPCDAAT